jgi:arylsulfatase A-like enzyme
MKPNIVFIVTDNQSPWTLGCYGNGEILTPNIDRLARGGVRFTNAFCSNPVCSPNRATCLTGLMPSQHGVHNWLGTEVPDAQMGPDAYCTIEEFDTLPQMLADDGYECGLSGKWHLGDSLHPQLGFKYWFAKPKGHTRSFHDAEAIWDGKVYREPRYYLDAITDHAVGFLHETPKEKPFFLCVGYNGPYGLDQDMRDGHRNRHTAYYADRHLECFPREKAHPWLIQNRDCIGNETAMRSYAAAVSGVDDSVGRILDALAELSLVKDTLVIFTADHGLCAGHHGFWGMSDHGRPLMMFDTNLRVPLILRHPERIAAGAVCELLTCNYDLYPSLLEYLDLPGRVGEGPSLPGRSYSPALVGSALDWGEEITFHEYENARTVRTPQWKFTRRFPDGPDDLYNLQDDPEERHNLTDILQYKGVARDLSGRLDAFFDCHSVPKHDLWRGGNTKAGRSIPEPRRCGPGQPEAEGDTADRAPTKLGT